VIRVNETPLAMYARWIRELGGVFEILHCDEAWKPRTGRRAVESRMKPLNMKGYRKKHGTVYRRPVVSIPKKDMWR
jgi:hypothetical protein